MENTPDTEIATILHKLKRYRPGDSFFIEGAKRSDVEFLRRPAKDQGVGISIVHVDCDEIYHLPGVRVFRKEGEFDQL